MARFIMRMCVCRIHLHTPTHFTPTFLVLANFSRLYSLRHVCLAFFNLVSSRFLLYIFVFYFVFLLFFFFFLIQHSTMAVRIREGRREKCRKKWIGRNKTIIMIKKERREKKCLTGSVLNESERKRQK